jgi:hypothetical protein
VISRKKLLAIPEFKDFERGGIVGMARVDGIVTAEDQVADFWFQGPLALALSAVRPLPFAPCNGQLGFFDVDEDALALCGTIAHAQRFTRAA